MTSKNRKVLNNFAKEREEFERQKKELEAQMHKGKQNLGHIRKGMRTNEISHLKDVDAHQDGDVIHTMKSAEQKESYSTSRRRSIQGLGKSHQSFYNHSSASQHGHSNTGHANLHAASSQDLSKLPSFSGIYMPSSRRVSDWFFTNEDPHGRPAGVKTQDVYTTVRFLGRGAFGSVDLVKHVDDNRLYAQKTVLLEDSEVGEDILFKEVYSLRVNRHPFIVGVTDVYCLINPRRLFIVLQYCEGGDLAKMISLHQKTQAHFPETQILKWIGQIALAMQYLQENHYLHRDIKPANILICDNGDIVKLGDFGFAVKIDENNLQSLSTAEVGTPYYTAPEMILQEPCSFPSDNWSFGIMCYEILLLGRHPFDGATTADLVRAIIHESPPDAPSMYSREFVDTVNKLLNKDPTERMTMHQLLTSPALQHKVAAIPATYKPKYHMEDRFRRAQVKQLIHQIESLGISSKSAHSLQHHGSSTHHSEGPPAPQMSHLSKIDNVSERGIKFNDFDSVDSLEDTKKKLSLKYETNERNQLAHSSETIFPPIQVCASTSEDKSFDSVVASNGVSTPKPAHLPNLGKGLSSTQDSHVLKIGSPSMHTHKEEEFCDVEDDKDILANKITDEHANFCEALFTPRDEIDAAAYSHSQLPINNSTSNATIKSLDVYFNGSTDQGDISDPSNVEENDITESSIGAGLDPEDPIRAETIDATAHSVTTDNSVSADDATTTPIDTISLTEEKSVTDDFVPPI